MFLFEDLKWESHPLYEEGQGIMARVVCDNGYRASIVRTPHSFGGTSGLYAMMISGPRDQATDFPEVKGWLTPARVSHQLITLQNLPAINDRAHHNQGTDNEEV